MAKSFDALEREIKQFLAERGITAYLVSVMVNLKDGNKGATAFLKGDSFEVCYMEKVAHVAVNEMMGPPDASSRG